MRRRHARRRIEAGSFRGAGTCTPKVVAGILCKSVHPAATRCKVDTMPPNRVRKADAPATGSSVRGCGSVANTPRHEFSARTKHLAWERANGFCEGWIVVEAGGCAPPVYVQCNAPIDLGEFHYDQIGRAHV